ncbi:S-layer homology domain-containing protein [Anaerotignum sp.]|uniref:S-layer homology domain-containing protein n=1 Tax=Anaerotignum sp. TaxID=2039241 RepID=UPI002FE6CFD1
MVNYWAETAINDMDSRIVISGDGAGNYNPNKSIPREDIAAIVVRAIGLSQGTTESSHKDVAKVDWFSGYVDTASEYELINGYDASIFGSSNTITRE